MQTLPIINNLVAEDLTTQTLFDTPVGEIVAKDLRKAEVFKKHEINFCCGGKKTLAEACKEANADVRTVIDELQQTDQKAYSPIHDFSQWPLDFLADYIYNVHHNYVRSNSELIIELAAKVARHHGEAHPELQQLASGVHTFMHDLFAHMEKEEKHVFPYIKKLLAKELDELHSITSPIAEMEAEHEASGDELRTFRALTSGYTLPANACNSYKLLFSKIQEFEIDLFQHIHLENNILFPKAIQLENELNTMK